MVLTSLFRSGMSKLASFAGGTTGAIVDMKPESAPLVTFGVCTDLQWAEVDDRIVHGTTTRRYRRSLQLAQVAAQDFQKQSAQFAIHLGDIVDGVQRSVANEHGGVKSAVLYALEQALAAFGRFTAGTTYHVLGNHCLYCFSRRHLQKRLGMNGPGDRCYYSFLPHPKLRMIVLDTYDVAVIGNASSSKEYQEASALLDEHAFDRPAYEADPVRRWVHFNGAVGKAQLEWLREELTESSAQGQRAVVCSHCPVHPESAGLRSKSLLWNYEDVLAVVAEADNVLAFLSGHIHQQGHHVDGRGVHFITMPALLEAPQHHDARHGLFHVYKDGFVLEGRGAVSRIDGRAAAAAAAPRAEP